MPKNWLTLPLIGRPEFGGYCSSLRIPRTVQLRRNELVGYSLILVNTTYKVTKLQAYQYKWKMMIRNPQPHLAPTIHCAEVTRASRKGERIKAVWGEAPDILNVLGSGTTHKQIFTLPRLQRKSAGLSRALCRPHAMHCLLSECMQAGAICATLLTAKLTLICALITGKILSEE